MSIQVSLSWKVVIGDMVVFERRIESAQPTSDSQASSLDSEPLCDESLPPVGRDIVLPAVTSSIYPGLPQIVGL